MSTFQGFDEPQANYSKLPHALIDELPQINSVSELKVILYILRHTWGFQDSEKKITIDEFSNGRKRSDGSRMDSGCGITGNSVRAGLDAAIEHGYIIVDEDASDLARIKRWYSINSRGAKLASRGAKVEPLPSKVEPRTEKETSGKKPEKETFDDDRPTAKSAGDRDGRMLLALIQQRGFMYLDSQASLLAIKLEDEYTDSQLRTALDSMTTRHQDLIKTGKRGITAPLAYLRSVLVGMDDKPADKNPLEIDWDEEMRKYEAIHGKSVATDDDESELPF